MPKLTIRHPHSLSLDDAKIKVKEIVDGVQSDYPQLVSEIQWKAQNTQAKAKGKMFKGEFKVDAGMLYIDLSLSFLATPFMGRVENKIRTKIAESFS